MIIRLFIFITTLILVLSSCSKKSEPNIVLIVVDDIGYADMSHLGIMDDVNTPNIDKLAKSGMRFNNAYATSSICSPSRMGLITGVYQERYGTYWYGGEGLHLAEYKTIPELLKQKNYTTGYIGKVHYGTNDSDTKHRSFPLNHGFDYFLGHTSARKHYLIHDSSIEKQFQSDKKNNNRSGQSLQQGALWNNFEKLDTMTFTTELFGKKACDFIDKNRNNKFFLQLSFNAVHNFTHQLPKEYLDSMNLNGYTDWNPKVEEYRDWYEKGRYPNNPEGRQHYLGQLYFLDKEIGRVMDRLNAHGLTENTIVVFISDNGGSTPIYANNFPLRGSKYTNYEGGLRVPLFISYASKYAKNQTCENLISAMDILPTICSEAGINTPDNIDGIDLSPLLSGTDTSIGHKSLFWYTKEEMSIRKGQWKYTNCLSNQSASYEMVDLELGEHLYNLNEDISESINLINVYPNVASELKNELIEWIKEIEQEN